MVQQWSKDLSFFLFESHWCSHHVNEGTFPQIRHWNNVMGWECFLSLIKNAHTEILLVWALQQVTFRLEVNQDCSVQGETDTHNSFSSSGSGNRQMWSTLCTKEGEYYWFYQLIPLNRMCLSLNILFALWTHFTHLSLLKSKIVVIFVVTLPVPLPAGSCRRRHAPRHMPSTHAKRRLSLQHPATSFRCLVCCLGDSVPTNLTPFVCSLLSHTPTTPAHTLFNCWLKLLPKLGDPHCDNFFSSVIKYVLERCEDNTSAEGHTQNSAVLLRKWLCKRQRLMFMLTACYSCAAVCVIALTQVCRYFSMGWHCHWAWNSTFFRKNLSGNQTCLYSVAWGDFYIYLVCFQFSSMLIGKKLYFNVSLFLYFKNSRAFFFKPFSQLFECFTGSVFKLKALI